MNPDPRILMAPLAVSCSVHWRPLRFATMSKGRPETQIFSYITENKGKLLHHNWDERVRLKVGVEMRVRVKVELNGDG